MSRILLINPPREAPLLDWATRYPPLGLMSIAAVLDEHDVEIVDTKLEKGGNRRLAEMMRSADIVGITTLTPSLDSALQLCRIARESGTLTVLGGVHPSLMPGVATYPEVDIAVRGEGELTFREIAGGRPLSSIQGISYKSGGTVAHNPDRAPADLEALPPPGRDLVSKYQGRYRAFGKRLDAVSTTRGCPYRCSFCCVPVVWQGYRELSPQRVIDEIKRTGDVEIVSIVDDNFCHDMERVELICDLIVREGLDDRMYSVFSRVDSVVRYPDVVRKMARANMRVVFIGIEAASQEGLDRMNKRTRMEDIYRACEILEENGVLIWAGHIIGNLEDTYEDVNALIDLGKRLPIDIAQYTVVTPYPGTELYRLGVERGLIDDFDFADYCECEPHMHTRYLSTMEIMELEMKAYLKFYSLRSVLKRSNRWSRNEKKTWINRDIKGIWSFGNFRNRCAFYFWGAYKETVGRTQNTRVRKYSPLVSTPVLYSIAAAVVSGLVTLLVTAYLGRYYGEYASRASAYIVADLLFAAVFVAAVNALACTPLGIRSYRKGWILSLRRRKPAKRGLSVAARTVLYAGAFSAAATLLTAGLLLVRSVWGVPAELTYTVRLVVVTVTAFLKAGLVSYLSIRAVRNGGVTPG